MNVGGIYAAGVGIAGGCRSGNELCGKADDSQKSFFFFHTEESAQHSSEEICIGGRREEEINI